MKFFTSGLKNSAIKYSILIILTFLLAFVPRYYLIKSTPEKNKNIDICIYINGGQLIYNKVNPYDFNDKVDIRTKLRLDTTVNDSWIMEDQNRWNFYASGNLPASLLYYGAIEYFANGNAFVYRIVFAIMDALLSVLILFFIVKFWIIKQQYLKYLFAILTGVFNPVLFYCGTLIPEDKGLQILLMLAAIFFAKDRKILLSSIFMGLSISFKGLGVFLLPLCLYYIIGNPVSFKELISRINLIKSIKYVTIVALICILLFIPFLPEIFQMMQARLSANLSGVPSHSSIWRIPFSYWPDKWTYLSKGFMVLFLLINIYGFVRKKFDLEIITASILILFVDISLNGGSLDRMNIGFLLAILILGTSKLSKLTLFLSTWYFLIGLAAFIIFYNIIYKDLEYDAEQFDSIFSLIIISVYTLILVFNILNLNKILIIAGTAALISCSCIYYHNKFVWKESKAPVEEIMVKVGLGLIKPDKLDLTPRQRDAITSIIIQSPDDYNDKQKKLIFDTKEKEKLIDILFQARRIDFDIKAVKLNSFQRKKISILILSDTSAYNQFQKSLMFNTKNTVKKLK